MITEAATATLEQQEGHRLAAALRAGDEAAYGELVDRFSPAMLRLAEAYVGSRAVAEEVVQEAWLGVISGIERFEGRSSVKTWLFRILTNCAKTRGARERRSLPFSALARDGAGEAGDEDDRFLPADHPEWPRHWASSPCCWDELPEVALAGRELRDLIEEAVAGLPAAQRAVITLRDVQGFAAEEVCGLLGVSEENQRVLLHRARTRVRDELDRYHSAAAG